MLIIWLMFFIQQLNTGLSHYIFLALRLNMYLQGATNYRCPLLVFIMFVDACTHPDNFSKVTGQSPLKEWPFPNCTNALLPQIMHFLLPTVLYASFLSHFLSMVWPYRENGGNQKSSSLLPLPLSAPSSMCRFAATLL